MALYTLSCRGTKAITAVAEKPLGGRSLRTNPVIGCHIPENIFDDNPKGGTVYGGNKKEKTT